MGLVTSRRSFLTGLIAAPLVVRTPGLLMPVKVPPPITPDEWLNAFGREVLAAYREMDRDKLLWAAHVEQAKRIWAEFCANYRELSYAERLNSIT